MVASGRNPEFDDSPAGVGRPEVITAFWPAGINRSRAQDGAPMDAEVGQTGTDAASSPTSSANPTY